MKKQAKSEVQRRQMKNGAAVDHRSGRKYDARVSALGQLAQAREAVAKRAASDPAESQAQRAAAMAAARRLAVR